MFRFSVVARTVTSGNNYEYFSIRSITRIDARVFPFPFASNSIAYQNFKLKSRSTVSHCVPLSFLLFPLIKPREVRYDTDRSKKKKKKERNCSISLQHHVGRVDCVLCSAQFAAARYKLFSIAILIYYLCGVCVRVRVYTSATLFVLASFAE